ncbi:GldG family protein [soil metagenome]
MSKKLMGASGLLIALVLLLSINTLSSTLFRGKQIDLTESKLYTLSQGSRNVVKGMEEPIKLRFYFSDKLTNNIPTLKSYGERVKELLQEYAKASNGKISLETIDPEPFSEAEEKAVSAGIQGIPISRGGENIYFGVEGSNSTDTVQNIPFFDPQKEEFLEYDISSLIYNLNHPEKRKIAILTTLPMEGSQDQMAQMRGQKTDEPWVILQTLRKQYDVQMLPPSSTEIPKVDLLLVIHPKDLPAPASYAIDQYALGGGKVMVFVDPHAEADPGKQDPNNQFQAMMQPKGSDMPELLKAWGLELEKGKVVGDRTRAQQVNAGSRTKPEVVDYVVYMSLLADDMNKEDIATSQLQAINLGTAGALKKVDGAKTEITPLLQSTEDSQLIDVSKVQMFPNPKDLYNNFESSHTKQLLAARVRGHVSTAFPDGPAGGAKSASHLSESKTDLNAVVIADADMLADNFWVQKQNFFGQTMLTPIANNGDFIINLVDNLAGSDDLISIRSRGKFNRPFDIVKTMERDAQKQFATQEKDLQKKLEDTEKKLQDLQASKGDKGSTMILSDEQQDQIKKFREDQVETRKKLRAVQLDLRKDIEKLGQKLKFINIALIPILVGVIAVGLGIFRSNRKRR